MHWIRDTQKKTEAEKYGDKDGKAFYKLMNNAIYGKAMENLRNRIDVKLVANEKKRPFRMYLKTKLYFAQIFNYNLVKIHKSKVPLKFNNHNTLECVS